MRVPAQSNLRHRFAQRAAELQALDVSVQSAAAIAPAALYEAGRNDIV